LICLAPAAPSKGDTAAAHSFFLDWAALQAFDAWASLCWRFCPYRQTMADRESAKD
jgi:hypothetical protein